jgi:hypothetical protein
MTQTFTQEHKAKLEEYLATHTLSKWLGSPESACSIAAINLAMTGTLTDDTPDCMSEVLGAATIRLQDAMPDEMRNSMRYKALLPDMAGTHREHERERLGILMEWLWSVVFPQLQPLADKSVFGAEWEAMCKLKTSVAASAAASAAFAAAEADTHAAEADTYADAYVSADAAAEAASAYEAASEYVSASEYDFASASAARAADAAAEAAASAADADAAAASADFWETVDPIGVLERMTYLNVEETNDTW